MTTHETVNRLYAEIQSLLRKNLGAEGKGVFGMLKSVEGKLSAKLVWELRLIGNIRNQVVHECLEPVPRYFEALCGEAIEGIHAVQAALAPKTNSSQKTAETKPSPKQPTSEQQVSKSQAKAQATNSQASKQQAQKKPTASGQSPTPKASHLQNSKPQKSKQPASKQQPENQQATKQQPGKPQFSSTKQRPKQ